MKFMKYAGLSVVLLAGSINLSQAMPYSVSGSFLNPGFSDPSSLHYLFNNDQGGNASLPAVAEFGWGVNVDALASSRFQFDGAKGDAGLLTDLPLLIKLGSFSYTNLPTVLVGKTVTVDLKLNLAMGDPVQQTDFSYGLKVNNTPGKGTPDTMQIVSMPGGVPFNVKGINYKLALAGFSADGGGHFPAIFSLAEGATLNMGVYARLNRVSPVPVPSAIWLFGTALIGLAGISRRTRK